MKFGKDLRGAVESSNPEWAVTAAAAAAATGPAMMSSSNLATSTTTGPMIPMNRKVLEDFNEMSKSTYERQFFFRLHKEVDKTNLFFKKLEVESSIRWDRIWNAYLLLRETTSAISVIFDKNGGWARLLTACVNFYKDMIVVEHYAILNYEGFSKILKKHDKVTGFVTRNAFMKKVVNQQKIANYPKLLDLMDQAEHLFRRIQVLEKVVPLQAEEKLFIDVIRGLNGLSAIASSANADETSTNNDEVQKV